MLGLKTAKVEHTHPSIQPLNVSLIMLGLNTVKVSEHATHPISRPGIRGVKSGGIGGDRGFASMSSGSAAQGAVEVQEEAGEEVRECGGA